MSLGNTLRTALKGIAANALRSMLTALGVVIGVASVITTLALGNGARASVDASFRFLGSDQIQINTKMDFSGGDLKPVGKPFTFEEGLNLVSAAPLVDYVEMSVAASAKIRSGRNVLDMAVTGTTANAVDQMAVASGVQPVDWPEDQPITQSDLISQGRFFTPTEVMGNSDVCVLGFQTAQDLFGGLDPINQTVWIDRRAFTVIGVLTELETENADI
jgi:putative ABC transport system permease protein